jgi:hypothetical protein
MLPLLKIGAALLLWCSSVAAFAQSAQDTLPGAHGVNAPNTVTPVSCKIPTSERDCFKVDELSDRIIFCANTGRYYVFFPERPSDLDQHCLSATNLHAAADGAREDNPADNNAKKIKALIASNDASFMAGEKQTCGTDERKKLGSRVAGIQDVNTVLLDPRLRLGREPIGMIGGVFCDRLALSGIDITRSLVFDYSVFLNQVSFSSITESANLSFNRTSIVQGLHVSRSRIAGGLFFRDAVIDAVDIWQSNIGLDIDISKALVTGLVSIAQTKIGGPVDFSESTFGQLAFVDSDAGADISVKDAAFLGSTRINRSRFAGSLVAQGAAFSALEILYNKFSTNLSFQNVGARCGVNLSNNTIGNDLTLSKVNLGKSAFTNSSLPVGHAQYRWSDTQLEAIRKRLKAKGVSTDIIKSLANDELKPKLNGLLDLAEHSDCKLDQLAAIEAMRINDNRVEKNVCLNEFEFSEDRAPTTRVAGAEIQRVRSIFVSLGGSSAQGATFLSFWPIEPAPSRPAKVEPALPSYVIDLVGFQTGALVPVLRKDYDRAFRLLTTGVRFDRIFANGSGCGFTPNSTNSKTHSNLIESAGLRLPEIGGLLSWLTKADTTQPYASAIAAFDRAGVDATDLKIQKARFELVTDASEKWNETVREWQNADGFLEWIWLQGVGRLWDCLRLIATGMLGWVADYGYRPQKAILYVVAAVLGFTICISKKLKVRWAATDVQNRVVPVGWIFVLDYMIPAYNIDEAHFKIREFRFENGLAIDADTNRRLQRVLRWIRVTGAIAVVFVVAVFKTLVVG